MPLLTKIFGQLAPRANWSFHWDGLEKLPLFSAFASRVSLDHAYNSNYKRRWRIAPAGDEITESQTIGYNFAPLAGVNLGFKDFIKGNFGATFRYGLSTSYDLVPSGQNVVQSDQTDISVTANFSRSGFEIPFFGLSLSNDIDISFSYTNSQSSRRQYDFKNIYLSEGQPLEGSTRSTMEPRIRYTLSARVTASAYYRYTKIAPDNGGSKIPGSTTNEGGLDIHVAIQ
ncbi:MAG: hypothetical protein HY966_07790 [Ignavibacteriales bacterium]|nr:hypothetical protein [Ignavibacteriales bacterium]